MIEAVRNIFRIRRESKHYTEVFHVGGLDERPLTEQEVKDRIQYWCSKYCNSIMVDERDVYYKLMEAYNELYKLKFEKNGKYKNRGRAC